MSGVAVSGSWDDLFDRASAAADANAPNTDELFARLIGRLNKLPEKILAAGDYHLIIVRDRAIAVYAGWLVRGHRLEEAVRLVVDDTLPLLEISAREWLRLRARILALYGEQDAAEEYWKGLIDASDDPDELMVIVDDMIDTRHFVAAALAIRKYEAIAEQDAEGHYSAEDDALVTLMYAQMYAALGKPRETTLWLKRTVAADPGFVEFLDIIMSLGWNGGFSPQDILDILKSKFLSKVQDDPAVLFWSAFAYQRMGNITQAYVLWSRLTSDAKLHELEELRDQLWFFSVANYYLGDKKAMGIGAALDALSEGSVDSDWTAFASAGIGWVLQDDLDAVELNLQLAANRYLGRTWISEQLPGPWREIAQDLMPAETFAAFEHFFQIRRTQPD